MTMERQREKNIVDYHWEILKNKGSPYISYSWHFRYGLLENPNLNIN